MKKVFITILAVLYLFTSLGATIHLHYCMGKLADWGLGHDNSKICGICGMEKKDSKDNGCCKDEQKFLKNSSDQKITESSFQINQILGLALAADYIEISFTPITSITEENPDSHAPPRTQAVPVYIRNCVFRI